MDAKELKPCPFCGSSNVKVWVDYVECGNESCLSFGPSAKTKLEAAELWNRRVALPSNAPQAQFDFTDLVNRFLSWPLPVRHVSDRCVSDADYHFPRSGTNLLDGREAEAMLRHVLSSVVVHQAVIDASPVPERLRRVMEEASKHLTVWLDIDDCDCDASGHSCGRSEVERTREKLLQLLAAPVAPASAAPSFFPSLGEFDPEHPLLAKAAQPDKRAAFEAWAKPRRYDLTRCSPAPYAAYKSDFTNGALAGWFGAHGQQPLSTETVDTPVQSVAADAEDASRYRWLRRQAAAVRNYASGNPNWEIDWALRGESFDAAVDAARDGASDDN